MGTPMGSSTRRWAEGLGLVVVGVAAPIVAFLASNAGEYLSARPLVFTVGLLLVVGLGGVVIAGRAGVDPRRAGMVAWWSITAFLHFHLVFDGTVGTVGSGVSQAWVQLVGWLVLVVAGARLAWLLGDRRVVREFVLVFGVLLTLIHAGPALDASPAVRSDATAEDSSAETDGGSPFRQRPNIYHLLVDQHPRADVARSELGLDISGFESELRSRGFWVGAESYASYPTTLASVPSTLEMAHVIEAGDDLSDGAAAMGEPILGGARALTTLRAEGYRYLYAPAGHVYWGSCRGDLVDHCLVERSGAIIRNRTGEVLLRRTPLSMIFEPGISYTRPEHVVDAVEQVTPDEPFVVFAHLLVPHEPFEYEADCTLRSSPGVAVTRAAYAQEVRCLDAELLQVVDRIRATDPDAVILIQSDHGTAFDISWEWDRSEWMPEHYLQRYAVFDARLGPPGCPDPPDGAGFVVDTYRWLFACLRGEVVEPLPDRAFWWNYDFDGDVVEIEDPVALFRRGRDG